MADNFNEDLGDCPACDEVQQENWAEVKEMWAKEKDAFYRGVPIESRNKLVCGLWGPWYIATLPLWHENGDTEYRIKNETNE